MKDIFYTIKEWWFTRADCPACDGTGDQAGFQDREGEYELEPCVHCDGSGKTTIFIARNLKKWIR